MKASMRGCLVFITVLLGLAAPVLAKNTKGPPVMLPTPKSCTWVQTGTVVPSGSYARDNVDGSLWKCSNGSWSLATKPPPKGKG
jgi:hypothetical protein